MLVRIIGSVHERTVGKDQTFRIREQQGLLLGEIDGNPTATPYQLRVPEGGYAPGLYLMTSESLSAGKYGPELSREILLAPALDEWRRLGAVIKAQDTAAATVRAVASS